jgi:hypothetical protein
MTSIFFKNKKIRKMISVVTIFYLFFIFFQPLFTIETYGSEEGVNVIINEDTLWTKEKSPYVITANTLVEQGATLTIEPGTEIRFDENIYLQVRGKLLADGNENDMIRFTANSPAPRYHLWGSIQFKENADDGSILNFCIIEYGYGSSKYHASVFVEGGLNTVTNNFFHDNYGGIHLSNWNTVADSFEIRSNSIINNTGFGGTGDSGNGIILNGEGKDLNIIITDNQLKRNFRSGIFIEDADSSSIVIKDNNIIENKEYGITIESSNENMEIMNNLIVGNEHGGLYGKMPRVFENNTVKDHEFGIITKGYNVQSFPKYQNLDYVGQNNNIYDNEVNVKNIVDQDLDFSFNWWGENDSNVIDDKIFDYYDDFNYGKIEYEPFLTSSNSNAPDEVDFLNKPPNVPEKPTGSKNCLLNVMYNFTISTTDPEGDQVMYGWDWNGDGEVYIWSDFYESGETVIISHVFRDKGRFEVKVKAMDNKGDESEWSDIIMVFVDDENNNDESIDGNDGSQNSFSIIMLIVIIILIIVGVILFRISKRIS